MTDKPKLATGDKALLHAAETGEGLITLTPDMLADIGKALDERKKYIDDTFPKLVAECPYETRLAVACWVIQHICAHARERGSYRYLIYDRLGFGPDAYVPLQFAGALDVSNEFNLGSEEAEKKAEEDNRE